MPYSHTHNTDTTKQQTCMCMCITINICIYIYISCACCNLPSLNTTITEVIQSDVPLFMHDYHASIFPMYLTMSFPGVTKYVFANTSSSNYNRSAVSIVFRRL